MMSLKRLPDPEDPIGTIDFERIHDLLRRIDASHDEYLATLPRPVRWWRRVRAWCAS